MSLPDSDENSTPRGLHGHVDFLGTGALSLKEEVRLYFYLNTCILIACSKSTFPLFWPILRCRSSFSPMSGSIILARYPLSGDCLRATLKL